MKNVNNGEYVICPRCKQEVCKEAIRTLLKDCGFQNVTIEVDEDLATHRAHKRNIEDLETDQGHGHDHRH